MATTPNEEDSDPPFYSDPLSLLAELCPHLDELDLDAIDGEFYWRCCRTDLLAAIDDLKAALARSRGPEHQQILTEGERGVLDVYHSLLNRFQPEFPNLERHLGEAHWIRLRDGAINVFHTAATPPFGVGWGCGLETRVELRVFSSAWSGAEAERRIQAYIQGPLFSDGWGGRFDPQPPRPPESVTVRVAFRFVAAHTEGDLFRPTGRPPLAHPHVLIDAGLPLPPSGTLAFLYDSIVRRERQWHLALAGAANRQEKRVALRTWAVGLLVASGRSTIDAIHDVCAALGEPEVTQVQFTEDRGRLIERVPEALSFLYAKPPRKKSTPPPT